MITVTKQFRFEAAHYLPGHEGSCKHLHGHSYLLETKFKNPKRESYHAPLGTMVIDFKDIKGYVRPFVDYLDHSLLNERPEFIHLIPTAETLCWWFKERILETPIGSGLIRVRVWETHSSYAEWWREDNA